MAISGLIPTSTFNMQINAGGFFTGLDTATILTHDALKTAIGVALSKDENRLGATTGGGTFSITPEVRVIEADGMRYKLIGATVFDSFEVKLTTTAKELIPENWKKFVPTAEIETAAEITKIRFRSVLLPEDYIPHLFWVGDILDGRLMLIKLDNALNDIGATMTFQDKGESSVPLEFSGHVSDLLTMDYAPAEIWYFKKSEIRMGAFK